ncbi:Tetratricopeptide repeat-containing protein [Bryocella elongata]|uniref:Tetratricopeptide repeat-containing protein n=1 Tax=Bryocella elongata TaxID=863522 RepID=A0A1H5W680_9BACT|nr:tetratricopeptide repeat protein [Bryocella elongata]SEF95029.1 Tetratricopeptide repeat-containing protein [Bryocella elongata]
MDNATKQALKQPDKFVALTENSIDWAKHNRGTAITRGLTIAGIVVLVLAGASFYQHRSAAASAALGEAIQTYQTPVATPGQELPAGMKSFPSLKDRASAANAEFKSVADQYGMMPAGRIAVYFTGLTYMEEGQNSSAEASLSKSASSWDGNVSALSKLALAQLYQQTGRDSQAVSLYTELTKTNATTVPAGLAQIQLSELYTAEGKTDQARQILAQLKDKDKDSKGNPGVAAEIATQKLNPQAAAQGPGLQ